MLDVKNTEDKFTPTENDWKSVKKEINVCRVSAIYLLRLNEVYLECLIENGIFIKSQVWETYQIEIIRVLYHTCMKINFLIKYF